MHIQVHSGERTGLCELKRCGGDALFARRCGCSACRRMPLCCSSRLPPMRTCVAQKQADKQQQYQFKPAQPWRITTWSTCTRTAAHRLQPVQVSRKRARRLSAVCASSCTCSSGPTGVHHHGEMSLLICSCSASASATASATASVSVPLLSAPRCLCSSRPLLACSCA